MIGSEFGARLRQLRRDRGLSQSDLARRSGVDQGWLSRLEAGTGKNPTAATLVALAGALDVTVTALSGTARTTLPLPMLDPAEAAVLELFAALRMDDPLGFLLNVARLNLGDQAEVERAMRKLAAEEARRNRPPPGAARTIGDDLPVRRSISHVHAEDTTLIPVLGQWLGADEPE